MFSEREKLKRGFVTHRLGSESDRNSFGPFWRVNMYRESFTSTIITRSPPNLLLLQIIYL